MPAAEGASPDKLSIILFSGDFERVHYALVLAAASAAIDKPVTLFLTMEACRAFAAAPPESPTAWRDRPAATGKNGGEVDDRFRRDGVGGFEDLLEACKAMGVRFMVCEMGLRAIGMDHGQLRNDITWEVGGVVTFMNDASADGAMLLV